MGDLPALNEQLPYILGSKIGFDATNKWPGETTREWGRPIKMSAEVKQRVDALWGELGL